MATAQILPAMADVPTPAPASAGVVTAAEDGSPEVSMVEPSFRPPQTWTYAPGKLMAKAGTPVTWINNGAVVHTVTTDDGKAFNLGDMGPKTSFSVTPQPDSSPTTASIIQWMKGTPTVQP